MTNTFKLPENIRFAEELGLDLIFQDVTVRGSAESHAQVIVTEEGTNGFEVKETYNFVSWEKMQNQYPTLIDFLKELSENEN